MNEELKMEQLPKDPGFTVPDRYFEELPTRIMQRTAYASKRPALPVAWYWQFKTALAGGALGLVFVLSFLVSNYLAPEPSTQEVMANLSQKDIYQYLVNHTDLETADLADVPAVKPRQPLEFLDVRTSDISDENTRELVEEYEYK
jgi:hypothetical protein